MVSCVLLLKYKTTFLYTNFIENKGFAHCVVLDHERDLKAGKRKYLIADEQKLSASNFK
jgi:hypothetical protein